MVVLGLAGCGSPSCSARSGSRYPPPPRPCPCRVPTLGAIAARLPNGVPVAGRGDRRRARVPARASSRLPAALAPGVADRTRQPVPRRKCDEVLRRRRRVPARRAAPLSLDDTVDRYLPVAPRGSDHGRDAARSSQRHGRLRQRLRQRSCAISCWPTSSACSVRRGAGSRARGTAVAEPGTTYHYTNANYIVLGAILQQITHTVVGRALQRPVIEPLGLPRTLYGPDDLAAAERSCFTASSTFGHRDPVDIGAFPRPPPLRRSRRRGTVLDAPRPAPFTHSLFATDTLVGVQRRLAQSASTLTAHEFLLDDRFVIHGHGGASPGAQTIVAYDVKSDRPSRSGAIASTAARTNSYLRSSPPRTSSSRLGSPHRLTSILRRPSSAAFPIMNGCTDGGSMAVDERRRHEMYLAFEELVGGEVASTMMEHLPPVGWADVPRSTMSSVKLRWCGTRCTQAS